MPRTVLTARRLTYSGPDGLREKEGVGRSTSGCSFSTHRPPIPEWCEGDTCHLDAEPALPLPGLPRHTPPGERRPGATRLARRRVGPTLATQMLRLFDSEGRYEPY